MGDSKDGDSDIMPWQDVSRDRTDRSDSSGSAASGLEAATWLKKRRWTT